MGLIGDLAKKILGEEKGEDFNEKFNFLSGCTDETTFKLDEDC